MSALSGLGAGRSLKEVIKVVIQLMVEDIWSNIDNYSL